MIAALLVAVAVLLAWRPGRRAQLLARLDRAPTPRDARRSGVPAGPAARRTAAVLGGLGLAAVAGGVAGLLLGAFAAVAVHRLLVRLPSRAQQLRLRRVERDLPLALDLLAACFAAGAAPSRALAEVARALPGPLGADLTVVAGVAALGALSAETWAAWPAGLPPVARPVAAAFARAEATGAAIAPMLAALADDLRHGERVRGEAAARRAGVLAVAPLGLCFLLGLFLLGVVPLVAGLIGGVMP